MCFVRLRLVTKITKSLIKVILSFSMTDLRGQEVTKVILIDV